MARIAKSTLWVKDCKPRKWRWLPYRFVVFEQQKIWLAVVVFIRFNRFNSQDMCQEKVVFFQKIVNCFGMQLWRMRGRTMENTGMNYGECGDELWRTRGRTMENAGTNYGERGDELWRTRGSSRYVVLCKSVRARISESNRLELPSWIIRSSSALPTFVNRPR